MRKWLAFGLVGLVLAGMGWLVHRRLEGQRMPPQRGGPRQVAVELAALRRADLVDERSFRGALFARSEFVVSPKVAGRLDQLLVDMGDAVQRGDLLAVLDGEEYALQVDQAKAELEVSEATLEEALSAHAVAESELRRVRELHREGVASDARLEEVESRKQATEARVNLARAQIRQREASLRSARVRRGYTRLHAEWEEERGGAWLVARRYADEGSMLRANDLVISVVELGTLRAVVHVIERDYAGIRPGLRAFLRTDAFPGEVFEGVVRRRAPVLEESSRHARVEIEVDNADLRLAPGMFVRVHLHFGHRENACVVPVEALTRRDGKQGVFLVSDDGRSARFVPVETGIQDGGLVEVLARDLAGQVVTLGHHLLEDGGAIMHRPKRAKDADAAEPAEEAGRHGTKGERRTP